MRWNVDSGQLLFPFTPIPIPSEDGEIIPLLRARPTSAAPSASEKATPRELFDRATTLETTAPSDAIALYRQILEREPDYADAHVNLGRLLHESNDVYAALVHYRAALSIRPNDPTAAFNTGVALEDLGASMDAIIAYRRAIEQDPCNPDAHYNLARLLEQVGKPDQAVRHLLLYRQLIKKQ
jgi:tetratricopeptide (TPR) repeat protein